MNKKLYYLIITPLVIAGFGFPEIQSNLLFVLILVASYYTWTEYKTKLKKAKGEEEIKRVIVPLILLFLFVALFLFSIIL